MDLWGLFWFLLAVGAVVGVIQAIAADNQNKEESSRQDGYLDRANSKAAELLKFEPERSFKQLGLCYIFADRAQQKFHHMNFLGDGSLLSDAMFSSSDILTVESEQLGSTLTTTTVGQTTAKGALPRAAIGAVAFGGAGAVVGAVSAPRKMESQSTTLESKGNMTIRLALRTPENPILTLKLPPSVGHDWLAVFNRAKLLADESRLSTDQQS